MKKRKGTATGAAPKETAPAVVFRQGVDNNGNLCREDFVCIFLLKTFSEGSDSISQMVRGSYLFEFVDHTT
jgi:hypothetical protein